MGTHSADMLPLVRSSRATLKPRHAALVTGDTLFAHIARAVCAADCLPRKELFEAWEVARRVRRRMRGGPVVELAAGHGLLAAILMLMDGTTPWALCVDLDEPPSHRKVLAHLVERWPLLAGRVRFLSGRLEEVVVPPEALIASVHACGTLTDRVLDHAIAARCRVAVLPCCHDLRACDTGTLEAWMPGPVAVDATRVARLRAAGFAVRCATIPDDITPQNRLIMGTPIHE
jgi:hypothetical protein